MPAAAESKPTIATRDRTGNEFGNTWCKNELTHIQKEAAGVGEFLRILDFLGAENLLSKWKDFDPVAFVQHCICISVNQILVCFVKRIMDIKLGM